jgi:hypothetical protein
MNVRLRTRVGQAFQPDNDTVRQESMTYDTVRLESPTYGK